MSESATTAIKHRELVVNGIRMHIAEQGTGPLVLLLHGFPESWYSWRHQFQPLVDAGYHVVAPDQRGYGGTDRPEAVDRYTILHLVGDVVALIGALGDREAVVVGHDWGAPVAWNTALLRPDIIRGVAGLSVPPPNRTPTAPLALVEQRFGTSFYQIYFQQPGVADEELNRNMADTFRSVLARTPSTAPSAAGFLGPVPETLPDWISEEDIAAYAQQYRRNGFTGPLNWYRNIDRNWELTAPWATAKITVPALFITGEQDVVRGFGAPDFIDRLPEQLPDLRGVVDLPDCGHWIQQEKPTEVNTALVKFLSEI